MTHPQVNSAKSASCESLLHDVDCHKTELSFGELWESRILLLRGRFGPLGCLCDSQTSVDTLAREQGGINFVFHDTRDDCV